MTFTKRTTSGHGLFLEREEMIDGPISISILLCDWKLLKKKKLIHSSTWKRSFPLMILGILMPLELYNFFNFNNCSLSADFIDIWP